MCPPFNRIPHIPHPNIRSAIHSVYRRMVACNFFSISTPKNALLIPGSFNTLNLCAHIKPKYKLAVTNRKGETATLSMAVNTSTIRSADESRRSLLFALATQAASQSQRFIQDLVSETFNYISPSTRFEARSLEETLMTVPNLETVQFKVLRREKEYEIREVKSFYVAETTMPGNTGFDFYGSSQGFNTLAAYLFGKNTKSEEMKMTTPVFAQKTQIDGEKMDMTTPVITKQEQDQGKWQMSFVMPSKYGENLPVPNDPSVRIRRIPEKVVAVIVFSGFVTDDEVQRRESQLRAALSKDPLVHIKENATAEVAQYNPPFTPPFMRRNEVILEVELKQD
ncbi:hypothetical protein SUGI_0432090 [Cryptomeria japonica]|uniref:heme-binding-like protein At3g10130, chloroplastic isoform X2 n=1 Tax=Cryptomeria japonica TaxID=3369 RepID=UPI002408DED1|nr:heme-binding-like protein At3g10130, chloroplastic isoform X2 [Cryptomeria japonica]GLJ22908.1 hypothetical protein SUGI_0432090 [Cryptomeria japonica]